MILVYSCGHVVRGERLCSLVVHHSDDTWQVMCGESDHDESGEDMFPIHLDHLAQRQPDIAPLATSIPKGFLAELIAGKWQQTAHDD
jgi:hypothetical protein